MKTRYYKENYIDINDGAPAQSLQSILAKTVAERGGNHCLTISLTKILHSNRSSRATKADAGMLDSISTMFLSNLDRYNRRICLKNGIQYDGCKATGFMETKTKNKSVEIYPHIHFLLHIPPLSGVDEIRRRIYINKQHKSFERRFSVKLSFDFERIDNPDNWSRYIVKHAFDEDPEARIILFPSGNSV